MPNLPAPPGLNASYRIVKKRGHRDGQPYSYSSLAKTEAALAWEEVVWVRLTELLRNLGLRSAHTVAYSAKSKQPELVPDRENPWFVAVYYRLVTSTQDADAPVKLLLDAAVERALGINDLWAQPPLGTKRFCEDTEVRGRGGHRLKEKPYMHVVIVAEEVADKVEFNERQRSLEAELLFLTGAEGALPED